MYIDTIFFVSLRDLIIMAKKTLNILTILFLSFFARGGKVLYAGQIISNLTGMAISAADCNINVATITSSDVRAINAADTNSDKSTDKNSNKAKKADKSGKNSQSDTVKTSTKPKNSGKANKKITFDTYDYNYDKALKYYNNGQYLSAAHIFEELYPLSIGTPNADTVLFLFADCYYKNKDYEMAAFHYKDYAKRYPGTEKAEYAHYLCVKSVYEISPIYSVDQSSTLFAIDEMDLFIKTYPHSPYVADCNNMLDILHEKLAQKDFEVLKLYYNTDHFQAVQVAAKNFLKEHPSSAYAAEAVYILVKSNLEYARKSVQSKKRERYQACIDAFDIMRANFPESLYFSDAQKIAAEARTSISKLKSNPNE